MTSDREPGFTPGEQHRRRRCGYDRAARGAAIAIVVGLGVTGIALPGSILVGGCAWLAALCFALSGWGWLVVRALRVDDVDFGLRAMWGIAGYLAVAGVLVALGVCSRPAILVLVALGLGGFAWREWVTAEPCWQLARVAVRAMRARPLVAYCAIVIGAAVVLNVIDGVAQLDRNPWDDDLAYTPLQQRLLQLGNLIEPFSFRRLASYGGQTVLQALGGARGNLVSIHLFDRGLCFLLVVLQLVGHARGRRVPAFWLAVIAITLVVLPEIAINTASYWSGVACFYALYRTVSIAESPRGLAIAALVGVATCTLRMNYLAVVVPYLAIVCFQHVRGAGWRDGLRTWRLAIALGAATLAPWCIAAFLSSRTFLYPFMSGTWNHGLTLQPTAWSWLDQLGFVVSSCIECEPLVVMPVIFALIAFARDDRANRPLPAFLLASTLGFVLLAHSFTSADTNSIWRYAFGYALALVLAFAVEAADEDGPVRVVPLARWTLLASLLVQVVFARSGVAKRYAPIFKDLEQARWPAIEAKLDTRRYAAMQEAVPLGARLVVMVDDPVYLDFRRNEIANLDTPGWASPAPQMPSFSGPEAMRGYFLDSGIRYVAFVRSERSRYFFRRDFWVWRIFNDDEVFQAMSAYLIDTIDTMAQLASTSKVLYDQDGLVVLDLDVAHAPAPELDIALEPARRDAFVRELAKREHLEHEWALSTRRDVIFAGGVSGLTYLDTDTDPHWYDVVAFDANPKHGVPVRWLHRVVHLRLYGDRDMHLVLRGHVNLNSVYSRPRLVTTIEDELIATVSVGDHGEFAVDTVVPREQLGGWRDLYLLFDSIGQPERDVRDATTARLEDVEWEPR
jgi:hypothetical protein